MISIRCNLLWLLGTCLLMACTPAQNPIAAPTAPSSPIADPTELPRVVPTNYPTQTPKETVVPSVAPPASPTTTDVPTVPPAAPPACSERQGHLSELSFASSAFKRRVAYSLYTPPCYAANPGRLYPALYLLHGANADHTQWPDLNVAPNADSLIAQHRAAPLVIVMPDGDYRPGEDYAAFVLQDLIPYIERTEHVAPDRAQRAIGGLSLGGAWALELALTHPEQFSAVGGHSPVSDRALKGLSPAAPGSVRVYLDVGKDDPLAASVEAFAGEMALEGFAPEFHVYAGGHDRAYWRAHSAEYLAFYAARW